MFGKLNLHLNHEKVKFNFSFTINELKSFSDGFKLKKVQEDESFTVYNKFF